MSTQSVEQTTATKPAQKVETKKVKTKEVKTEEVKTKVAGEKVVEPKIEQFRTKDLNQAAFIWCQPDVILNNLEVSEGKSTTVYFRFSFPGTKDDLSLLIFSYANGQTKVDPLQFSQNQTKLRDLLHMTLSNKRNQKKRGKLNV